MRVHPRGGYQPERDGDVCSSTTRARRLAGRSLCGAERWRYTPAVRRSIPLALGLMLSACRPSSEVVEPAARDASAAEPGPSLADFAEQFDPGPQPRITDGLPPWMFEMLELEPSPSDSTATLLRRSLEEEEKLDALVEDGIEDNAEIVLAIGHIARAVVLAEQAAARGEVDADVLARLERVYSTIDIPTLAGDRNAFSQFLNLFAQSAASDGHGPSSAAQLQQLGDVVQAAVRAAGPLHRHTVAELVRADPQHADVPLGMLAAAKARRGSDEPWVVPVAKQALAQRGASASAEEHLDLARVCYAALDVACGDAALQQAGDHDDADDVREGGALAKTVLRLDGETGVEPRLERARGLLELGRFADADAEFEALRKDAPQDARPVAGLAKLAIETELDFIGANRIIDGAGPLENGDAEYYEIAIGTRATAAMANIPLAVDADPSKARDLVAPVLELMQRDAQGYAALGNPDGRFLVLVLDVGGQLLDQYATTGKLSLQDVPNLTARIAELQSQIPDHGYTYRLLMSAAVFEADPERAKAAAGVVSPGGPEHDVLAVRHARALCDLAAIWSDGELAQACLREAESFPRSAATVQLKADALLSTVLLTGKASWVTVGQAYEPLLDHTMTAADARMLNNVAMSLWRLREFETALEAWGVAAQLATEYGDVPRLNLLIAKASGGSSDDIAALREFIRGDVSAGSKLTALAWLEAWARGKKAKKQAKAALAEAIASESKSAIRAKAPDPYSGLLLEGTLQASFGYASQTGLQIQLDASGLPWAVLAPER